MPVKGTGNLLKQLRALMSNVDIVKEPIAAYIIPSGDAHNSEYIAACDERRCFISGFSGSAGTAVVTQSHALLYTDGRYYLQASKELDENWTLMKVGLPETLSQGEWLSRNLPKGSIVGVDPTLYSKDQWDSLQKCLRFGAKTLAPIATNLIDAIWTDRPARPFHNVVPQPLEFAGVRTSEKLANVRKELAENGAELLIVSQLDEVAWLLNLRGSDIPYNPVFFAYVILTPSSLEFFIDPRKMNDSVRKDLCADGEKIKFQPYESIFERLQDLVNNSQGKVWMDKQCNYSLSSVVPEDRQIVKLTPISLMKAVKNPVEVQGMINCHIRDASAVCGYLAWLEDALNRGEVITEVSAADKLESFRAKQKHFVGLSFPTISGSGPNGAIIHYQPNKKDCRNLSLQEVYLVDSGGQYLDGTTDITRTVHFGTPTPYQKECYTRVLKGQIALRLAVFPNKLAGKLLDSFARKALWDAGLNYLHGTAHGVGSYLNVHEGPSGITFKDTNPDDPGLRENMFLSNEPGYYEDGEFGIRLENIIRVVPATTAHNFMNVGYLTFEDIVLVPIQQKMIDSKLLTQSEIEYLNEFHQMCRKVVGDYMTSQGAGVDDPGYAWLIKETEPIRT